MNVISPKQCRAARALLDITRADLSQISSVSSAAIGGFETEATTPRAASISLVRAALEGKGIEFLDDDGVRERKNTVRVYKGEKIHRQLLDEIYSDLKENGGEILIKGVIETSWEDGDDKSFLKNHLDRLKQAGITERMIVSEDADYFVAPIHWYRKIPSKYFTPHTHWIFANKVAMISWGDIETLTIIEDKALFRTERLLFDCVWDNVAKVVE
ncbi:hypothetical protein [Profundibacter amoris]|uniref:XRE family transcriptional regulator n=1 Tax=Profundibacter amoris TaxID=2171755 RepID=A0A347UGU6_9RHOB|nr:hypothetical protein [Profundibacter amoris]AXX98074.1 hypothetical protein BAR1_09095 [Profundibacter amoris]